MLDNSKKSSKPNKFKFSEAMNELEDIANYLESENIDIEVAMEKFKRGSDLAKQIKEYLQKAKNTINTIND